MVHQRRPSFQYQIENKESTLTAHAGMGLVIGLFHGLGLDKSLNDHLALRPHRGYSDADQVLTMICANILGGDSVDAVDLLEGDGGLAHLIASHRAETTGGTKGKKSRKAKGKKGKKGKKKQETPGSSSGRRRNPSTRDFPSASSLRQYLNDFDEPEESAKRCMGKAFIPKRSPALKGWNNVFKDFLAQIQRRQPQSVATLDQDATFIENCHSGSHFNYKSERSYETFNTYWSEQDIIVHSEYRDGNISPGWEQKERLQEALSLLPEGVEKVRLRSDSAGYQTNLLRYCAEGRDERFGVIDFAIACPMVKELQKEIQKLPAEAWKPLPDRLLPDGAPRQEYAEVSYVPNSLGHSKKGPDYRFLATREIFSIKEKSGKGASNQSDPGQRRLWTIEDMEEFYPALKKLHLSDMGGRLYKTFAIVTNMDWEGDELIAWQRKRCGKSEEAHHTLKHELAGGHVPSKRFGASAAWWLASVLAFNLLNIVKKNLLPPRFAQSRVKTLRFNLIGVAGRLVNHARRLWIKVSGKSPAGRWLCEAQWKLEQYCRLNC